MPARLYPAGCPTAKGLANTSNHLAPSLFDRICVCVGLTPQVSMVESNQVRVVVDPKSALFVSGSELDFSDDLQKGGFKVTNPNAVAHCSCGESFSA